jgi:hypothetical protein
MNRFARVASLAAAVALLGAAMASAQITESELVGFNGPPFDDEATSQEMFRQPTWSGSTSGFVLANEPNAPWGNNSAYRASGLQHAGAAAMKFFFKWTDPTDANSWLRMTTFSGPERPNPALRTLPGSKVRFWITNQSLVISGDVGICLGVRETGTIALQLADGGSSGDIEWIGVDPTPRAVFAGADGIVDTTAQGDDVQVYPVGFNIQDPNLALSPYTQVITPGTNGVLDTMAAHLGNDDQLQIGWIDIGGARRPVPLLVVEAGSAGLDKFVEFDLTTGEVFYGNDPNSAVSIGAGVGGMTGNGVLDVSPAYGTLEHIAITNEDAANVFPPSTIELAIDDLQFVSPEPEPVLAPTIVEPVLIGDPNLVVIDLLPSADRVNLLNHGAQVDFVALDPNDGTTQVIFTLPGGAPLGAKYSATQRDHVTGTTSPPSNEVDVAYLAPTVYAAPAAGDTSVMVLDADLGADEVWVETSDGLRFTNPITPGDARGTVTGITGLDPNDTIWGGYTVGGIDSARSVHETVTVNTATSLLGIGTCQDWESGIDPNWVQGGTDLITLTTERNATCAGGGVQSVKGPTTTVGAYMYQPLNTFATPTEMNPVVLNVNIYDPVGEDPAGSVVNWVELNHLSGGGDWFYMHVGMLGWSNTDNIHYDLRAVGNGGPNWIDMDQFDAPLRTKGWHTFTFVHKGRRIDCYVDGLLALKNMELTADTVYSQVDVGGGGYATSPDVFFDDLCVEVGPVRFGCIGPQPPEPAALMTPQAGATSVTAYDIDPITVSLDVLDAGDVVLGSATGPFDPNNPTEITGLSRPLVKFEMIRLRAINANGSNDSPALEVGDGPGPLLVSLGIRETGDTGPLGSEGGTAGEIEWLGATGDPNGAPQGFLVPVGVWTPLTFDPAGPITGFTGDGAIDPNNQFGVIEHLALAVPASDPNRSAGPYVVYVDNVVNVGADGGADFLITDFETPAPGDLELFQPPRFSGSTDFNLALLPNFSRVDGNIGNPGQSCELTFAWVDTTAPRWARVTTSGTTTVSRPIIDLTAPVSLDILIMEPGPAYAPGDLNCDGVVNFGDIDPFVLALTNPGQYAIDFPDCDANLADINGDTEVNFGDIDPFVVLLTGK